jgi:hypothetical protein
VAYLLLTKVLAAFQLGVPVAQARGDLLLAHQQHHDDQRNGQQTPERHRQHVLLHQILAGRGRGKERLPGRVTCRGGEPDRNWSP